MSKTKTKTSFFCQNCGAQSPKWVGKCSSCGEWNTYVEEVISKAEKTPGISQSSQRAAKPQLVSEISLTNEHRIKIPDRELGRVLGGGLVPGSIVLFGGEPGIGKSTLMLQFALSAKKNKVLYVSGEESEQQIRMRAERINPALTKNKENAEEEKLFILTETSIQNIFKQIELLGPSLLIID